MVAAAVTQGQSDVELVLNVPEWQGALKFGSMEDTTFFNAILRRGRVDAGGIGGGDSGGGENGAEVGIKPAFLQSREKSSAQEYFG
jgi:hypothetical protein